jgi:hypothetical protein
MNPERILLGVLWTVVAMLGVVLIQLLIIAIVLGFRILHGLFTGAPL